MRVQIRRRFVVSPERVFAAFSDPALIERWLSPSPAIAIKVLHFDFRVGGEYRFRYDGRPPGEPGEEPMFVGGHFRTIEPPYRIVFTWIIDPPDVHAGIESVVTVSIDGASAIGPTELVVQHEGFDRDDANARHDQGWRGALDRLETLDASEPTLAGRES